jgi:hypothetical protein
VIYFVLIVTNLRIGNCVTVSNSLCVVVLDGSPSGLSFYVPFGLLCLVFVQKQRNFTDREMLHILHNYA